MTLHIQLRHAFPDFLLEVDMVLPGGLTCLFGRSGSGKTSIVNAVAGLLRPDAARIVLDGSVLNDLPPHRRDLGYVFQDARLFPHLTVAENLCYGPRVRRRKVEGMAQVVELLGIGGLLSRRPGTLSGGERQRVAIGRALLARPRLLLMDEPLAALDEARKAEILPYIEALRDETGLPILYVSHSLPEVARLATTIAVIEAGRVAALGPAAWCWWRARGHGQSPRPRESPGQTAAAECRRPWRRRSASAADPPGRGAHRCRSSAPARRWREWRDC